MWQEVDYYNVSITHGSTKSQVLLSALLMISPSTQDDHVQSITSLYTTTTSLHLHFNDFFQLYLGYPVPP